MDNLDFTESDIQKVGEDCVRNLLGKEFDGSYRVDVVGIANSGKVEIALSPQNFDDHFISDARAVLNSSPFLVEVDPLDSENVLTIFVDRDLFNADPK